MARCGAREVNEAVSAASEAFTHWARLRPSQRAAKLLRQFADAIVANADKLAEIERRDNGKLAAEVNAQVRYLGDYFHYYAGLADKVQQSRHSDRQGRRLLVHSLRAERRGCDHHAVELPADSHQLETCTGARGWMHSRDQTLRVHVRVDD